MTGEYERKCNFVHEFSRLGSKWIYFVAIALSHDYLTKVRKAKLKPERERKGEPEGREIWLN